MSFLPLAHLGHYLWVFYLLPVLIVVVSILKATISEKRKEKQGRSEDPPQ
ncbi:MAG TPA: hypothetical protein VG518_07865 [Solirubrobacterales bacterium]|nr:hypothetical protein [Solirubrobacterales bacterium]